MLFSPRSCELWLVDKLPQEDYHPLTVGDRAVLNVRIMFGDSVIDVVNPPIVITALCVHTVIKTPFCLGERLDESPLASALPAEHSRQ